MGPAPDGRPAWALGSRRATWGFVALLAAIAYIPLLLTARGKVAADSKQVLFLDPDRFLSGAASLWQPEVHLGTVTHQNIGYLFPVGPIFWAFAHLGVPDWVAQRLWLGSILFLAGVGMLYFLRTFGVTGVGVGVAALVYMLSPYTLEYASRLSVLLLAWTALPWMAALVARALKDGGWRYPAAFAIVVQIAGSINLTALLWVGIAPVIWILFAVFVSREVDVRRALATVGKIALLTILASAWWLAGLSVEGGYALNVLRYSETINIVATGGHAAEVLRSLGNWFFYGGDKLGPWIESALDYTGRRWVLVASYAIPILAFGCAAILRWRYRAFFVMLILIGVVLGVGAHPYDDPTPFGAALKAFSEGSSIGMSLRSVGRAAPLVLLGVATLIGVVVNLVVERMRATTRPWLGGVVVALVAVLVIVNLPALWNGTFYGKNLLRPEEVPSYWQEAIADLDARPHDTRILELPGSDFAAYRWGNAVEPITPGLTSRPYVARELIPYGTEPSANLLEALDRRLQMGLLEPSAIGPLARLLGIGDLVLRSDLQVDRYDLARPKETVQMLTPLPEGIGAPTAYGDSLGPLTLSLLDDRSLAIPPGTADPAPVEVYPVADTPSILHAQAGPGLVVSGDGDGLVDLASLGLLDRDLLVRYAASYANNPKALKRALGRDAVLVVTDTNRRRAQRWGLIRDNTGYTERAGQEPTEDPFDNRLEVFPDAGDDAQTVMQQHGAQVDASSYGMAKIAYLPADRAARALDGDLDTAWRVGRFAPVEGEWIRIEPDQPVRTDRINLVQPLTGPRERYITRVALHFTDADGHQVGDDVEAELGAESRARAGQTITFPAREFATVQITIDDDNVGKQSTYFTESAVGFAEIRLRDSRTGTSTDVRTDEVVRMPRDLTEAPGAANLSHALIYEMTRLRNRQAEPNIAQEETALSRQFDVPATRDFAIVGQARVSPLASDVVIDRVLGYAGADAGGIDASSSSRLRTTLASRASSAFDGSPTTAWTPEFGPQAGQWLEVATPAPVTFDHLDLAVVADGQHSVPTRLRVEGGGQTRTVDVPPIADGAEGSVTSVPVSFAPLTGPTVRVSVDEVRSVGTTSYYSNTPIEAPVGIAELGIPGVVRATRAANFSTACVDGLVTVDGRPLAVTIAGDVSAAEAGGVLDLVACGSDASGRRLAAGTHELRATPGAVFGFDLDRLVLASEAGGAALSLDREAAASLVASGTAPQVEVTKNGRTSIRAEVRDADEPFWLVLGQSQSPGWKATANGTDLGEPELVNGYGNGWRIDPGDASTIEIALDWTPQRQIWIALGISAITMLVCVGILIASRRRVVARTAVAEDAEPELDLTIKSGGATPSRRAIVLTTLGVTVLGAIVAAPWAGLVAGGLTLLALRSRWRWPLPVGAVGALVVTCSYIVFQQSRYHFPSVIDWPTFFDRVHVLGLLGVVLLFADAVVVRVREQAGSHGETSPPTPVEEDTRVG